MKAQRPEGGDSSYRAPAVGRALEILRILARGDAPLGVSELARRLGASKGAVHGVLGALLREGAVEEEGDRRFRLGPLVDLLARGRRRELSLVGLARPHLERLAAETGQTALLGVPEGDRLRVAAVCEGRGALRVTATEGQRIPLLAGATGKVALAWGSAPWPEVPPTYTPRSPADRTALEADVSAARRAGVAFDRGEYLRGVAAAAAPVSAPDGRLAGILYAVGFEDLLGEEGLQDLGARVREEASALAAELG